METGDSEPQFPHRKRKIGLTTARFLMALLAIELFLSASECYRWFTFNERQGWTVRIAIAAVAAGLLILAAWSAIRLVIRRSVQFDLATMLMLIFVIAIPLGWFARDESRIREERTAAKWVEDASGAKEWGAYSGANWRTYQGQTMVIKGSPQVIAPQAYWVTVRTIEDWPPSYPTWLRKCLGEDSFHGGIRMARFGERFPLLSVEDERARPKKLPPSEEKELADNDLVHVGHLYELEDLTISSHKITDAGLRSLYGLRRLKKLTLVTPNVSPAGIAELRRNMTWCAIVQYDDIVEEARAP